MTSGFNYQVFLNSVKHCMNVPKAHNGEISLGNPYIAEVLLWSVVDCELLTLSKEQAERQKYVKEHLSRLSDKEIDSEAESRMIPSYSHFFIRKGVFNFDHSKGIFDESTKLVRNPRFRTERTGKYFYEYCDVRYPDSYSEDDTDYVNRFFDYINSKESRQSYMIERGKELDHGLLAKQWQKLAKLFAEYVCTDKLRTEAAMLTSLGNSDLSEILNKWIEYANMPEQSVKDPFMFCQSAAKLFLRTAAVSVMLTEEKLPVEFPKLKFYLRPYQNYKSRITGTDTAETERRVQTEIRCEHFAVAEAYKDVLSALAEWRNDPSSGYGRINIGSVILLLKEFRNIYRKLRENPSYMRFYDEQFREYFFYSVNNPYIQKKVILKYPDEYSYLFELYNAWTDYIKFSVDFEKSEDEEFFSSVMRRYDLIDSRIIYEIMNSPSRSYSFDVLGKDFINRRFTIRLAADSDFRALHKMHNPQKKWDPKIFINSSDEGIRYAVAHDQCWVIENDTDKQIACCAIIVPIGYTDDDLLIYSGMRKCREEFGKNYDSQIHFSEFNSVIVDPDHRGLGFQRLMLSMCYQFAAKDGSEYLKNNEPVFIGAEVSPINSYSHNNFTNMGYEVVSTIVFEDHGGVARDFVAVRVT